MAPPGNDEALSLRTTFLATYRTAAWSITGELLDARAYLSDGRAAASTSVVNPLDVLQAYVEYEIPDGEAAGGVARIRAGRFTLDLGSRRLVARNNFRNTINAFTGLHLDHSTDGTLVEVFATLPVRRRPEAATALRANQSEFDTESFDRVFWGVRVRRRVAAQLTVEGYTLGLHERNSTTGPTARRTLLTPGVRLSRGGRIELDVETALQFGTSTEFTAGAPGTRVHRAAFLHASVGVRTGGPSSPRVVAQFDLATGDSNPVDDRNNLFDPLFGARRFEYGPTGIWGVFGRSDVVSPGLRVEFAPRTQVDAFVGYRAFWRAGSGTNWGTTGLSDPSGIAGRFVGHQIEGRIRWRIVPANLMLELGYAAIERGGFLLDSPTSNPGGDPRIIYFQTVIGL